MGQVSSKENKIFRYEFDNNIWILSLQSNISCKFCFRKVDERISCNRNVQRPEEQQLVLLRDGCILLYLWHCLSCCWLLMFFPGACQHCNFHRGVQLLSLWCLCVNREVRWKFCGIISLAFPWRNSVCGSFTRMAFDGGRLLCAWSFLEGAHTGPPSENEMRESWCIVLCDDALHMQLKKHYLGLLLLVLLKKAIAINREIKKRFNEVGIRKKHSYYWDELLLRWVDWFKSFL